jgi:hypothetical protein
MWCWHKHYIHITCTLARGDFINLKPDSRAFSLKKIFTWLTTEIRMPEFHDKVENKNLLFALFMAKYKKKLYCSHFSWKHVFLATCTHWSKKSTRCCYPLLSAGNPDYKYSLANSATPLPLTLLRNPTNVPAKIRSPTAFFLTIPL